MGLDEEHAELPHGLGGCLDAVSKIAGVEQIDLGDRCIGRCGGTVSLYARSPTWDRPIRAVVSESRRSVRPTGELGQLSGRPADGVCRCAIRQVWLLLAHHQLDGVCDRHAR